MNYQGTGQLTQIILCAAFLSGCATQPIIVGNDGIYFGVFSPNRIESDGCEFTSIRGAGIRMGKWFVGAGYIESKRFAIDLSREPICQSEIANVFVGANAEEIARTGSKTREFEKKRE